MSDASAPSLQQGMNQLRSMQGQLLVLAVALLWGTNPPALRYLYLSDGTGLCAPETLHLTLEAKQS